MQHILLYLIAILLFDSACRIAVALDLVLESVITSSIAEGTCKWAGITAVGTSVYAVPYGSSSITNNQLLVYDTVTKELTGVDTSSIGTGFGDKYKWRGITAVGTTVYAAPSGANDMLVYDTVAKELTGVDTSSISIVGNKWNGITAVGTTVYAAPCGANEMLVYDTVAKELTGVDTSAICRGVKMWSGITAVGTTVYAAPHRADMMLVYDTVAKELTGVDTSSIATGVYKWAGITAVGTTVYAAPYGSSFPKPTDVMLVYDTVAKELTSVSTSSIATGNSKWHGITAVGTTVYAVPYGDSYDESPNKMMLVYDTVTKELNGVDTSSITSGYDKWVGVTAVGTTLYAAPFGSFFNNNLLVAAPFTSSPTVSPTPAPTTDNFKENVVIPVLGVTMGIIIAAAVVVAIRYRKVLRKKRQETSQLHRVLTVAEEKNADLKQAWRIPEEHCVFETMVAHGAYGQVFKGTWMGKVCAIKEIYLAPSGEPDFDSFDDIEVQLMLRLRHPRLCLFFGCGERVANGRKFMVLEWMSGGSLYEYIRDVGADKPWIWRIRSALDIAEGLEFLHGEGVLLDDDLRCKVADFGTARSLGIKVIEQPQKDANDGVELDEPLLSSPTDPNTKTANDDQENDHFPSMTARIGTGKSLRGAHISETFLFGALTTRTLSHFPPTAQWAAPELYGQDRVEQTLKTDIFSLGVVMWELLTLRQPWKSTLGGIAWKRCSEGERPNVTDEDRAKAPEGFEILMRECWDQVPAERPSASAIASRLRSIMLSA